MADRRVAVVTDSTAYLPTGLAAAYGITVVPLQVVIGGRIGAEGRDVTPADVSAALSQRRAAVSTSRPAPQAFVDAYAATGSAHVLSVHLSGALSGTVESATLAAGEVPPGVSVRVLDSRSIAMGMGFAVLAAAEAAATGAGLDEVAAVASAALERTDATFYVNTLEHLRRGGRIGAAQALLGSALMVKPILHVEDGRIAPVEKLRTVSKALARLEELAAEQAGEGPVDLAVHHLAASSRAADLLERLQARLPNARAAWNCEVGAVVGAHVGPGLLGVVIHRW